jgi:hypothetical protein
MKELGLNDNPFEPRRLRGVPKFVGELSTKALRVDECAALEPLYFDLFPVAAASRGGRRTCRREATSRT